jgi:hypothetical protein
VIARDQNDGGGRRCSYSSQKFGEPLQRALWRVGPIEDVACDNENVWLMIVDYRQDLDECVIMVVLQRHPVELAAQMPVTCVQNAHSQNLESQYV